MQIKEQPKTSPFWTSNGTTFPFASCSTGPSPWTQWNEYPRSITNFPSDKTLQGLLLRTAALTLLLIPEMDPSHCLSTEVKPLAVAIVRGRSMPVVASLSLGDKLPLLIKSNPLPLSIIHRMSLNVIQCHRMSSNVLECP